ncbi:hypothetical protein GCM10025771_33850 [Niveibacterium umoris]|uniref:DNA-binding MarR family transcriptional regulator n=1 Tax=Niveibacterium umoris TaxID=1193620 RepID=A0A840BIL6_9RHOO|nr:MarR family transcriptional regulator [Niveibacterium umoris]MBB4011422.1 DNA-binding MarR family transcriptional regulator [Niveibacterium umoris]
MHNTALREFARAFLAVEQTTARRHGLGADAQHRIASLLVRNGPVTPQALSSMTGLHKAWVTRSIKAMEASQQVITRPNPDDGRSILVEISPSGRQAVENINACLDRYASALLQGLAPADRAPADRILRRLAAIIQDAAPQQSADLE